MEPGPTLFPESLGDNPRHIFHPLNNQNTENHALIPELVSPKIQPVALGIRYLKAHRLRFTRRN